jgi:hypothetical protein
MPTAAIKLLKPHPAQMRTTYDLEALATLTLQIYERGLDNWQPVVASPNGEAYHIISGHRRHMAQLLALALRDWAEDRPDTGQSEAPAITIEVVRTMINTLVESLGALEKVVASLLTKYGEEEVTFVAFEGSQKAQILALAGGQLWERQRQTRWVSPTAFARQWKPGRRRRRNRPQCRAARQLRAQPPGADGDSGRNWRSASPPASCP